MSDDEPDNDLLDFLRQHFAKTNLAPEIPETQVLESAEYVYNNSIDVALDSSSCRKAAELIYTQMQTKQYNTQTWSSHELHPKAKDEQTVNFIFTMDLLNFSFWSEKPEAERYAVEYRGKRWTGYWSLVACLQRALEEGVFLPHRLVHVNTEAHFHTSLDIPITSSDFWQNELECTEAVLKHVFRSCTDEEIPLFHERMACLRKAGTVLYEVYSPSHAILPSSHIQVLTLDLRSTIVVSSTLFKLQTIQQQD